jgi:hypothetical protein
MRKFEFWCCGSQEHAFVDGILYKYTEKIPWKDRGTITCPSCFSDWDYIGNKEKEEKEKKE